MTQVLSTASLTTEKVHRQKEQRTFKGHFFFAYENLKEEEEEEKSFRFLFIFFRVSFFFNENLSPE